MNTALSPSIFTFLEKLKQNNDREWFAANRLEFEQAKQLVQNFMDQLGEELLKVDTIEKGKMYRIYRDTRFSLDKTPYKDHFGLTYKRIQPHNRGSFYVNLEKGNTFIGAGFWGPNKEDLYTIRKAIEMEDDLLEILSAPQLVNTYGELYGEALKTAPKGFDKEHPRVQLLRYKQFTLVKNYSDTEMLAPDFITKIVKDYEVLGPFFEYMTSVLTTDENGESII